MNGAAQKRKREKLAITVVFGKLSYSKCHQLQAKSINEHHSWYGITEREHTLSFPSYWYFFQC